MSTKPCPYCAEPIQEEAKKCKHCGEFLDESLKKDRQSENTPKQTPVEPQTVVVEHQRGGLMTAFTLKRNAVDQKTIYKNRNDIENKIKEVATEIYFDDSGIEYSPEELMNWMCNTPNSGGLFEAMMAAQVGEFIEILISEFSIEDEFFDNNNTYEEIVEHICKVQGLK